MRKYAARLYLIYYIIFCKFIFLYLNGNSVLFFIARSINIPIHNYITGTCCAIIKPSTILSNYILVYALKQVACNISLNVYSFKNSMPK